MKTLSVLLITRDRPAWLKRCLQSLFAAARQARSIAIDLQVGINGADPISAAIARELGLGAGLAVSVHEGSARRTPAAARNDLLPKATGEWILFIDDDAYVEPEYFLRFLEALERFPGAAAIGGPNLTPPGSTEFQRATGLALSSRLATYLSVARYQKKPRIHPCGENELILCNLFVRNDRLEARPFPDGFFCGEENWMLQTLSLRGDLLVYSPELFVWHERRQTYRELIHQVYCYGKGRGRNLRGRPESVRLPHVLPSVCVLYTVLAFSGGLFTGILPAFWLLLFLVYLGLCLGAALRVTLFSPERPSSLESAIVLALFPSIHVSYGVGVLVGWVNPDA